jgi:hypothetical protein
MKTSFFITSLVVVLFFCQSCEKYEGEGGKSSITGKILITERLYVQSNLSDSIQYPGATEDVYIVYGGDSDVPDDKVECGYDGTFRFEYLQPGTYTIYAYSEIFDKGNNISNNDDDHYVRQVVKQTIELNKKEDLDLGTIHLIK